MSCHLSCQVILSISESCVAWWWRWWWRWRWWSDGDDYDDECHDEYHDKCYDEIMRRLNHDWQTDSNAKRSAFGTQRPRKIKALGNIGGYAALRWESLGIQHHLRINVLVMLHQTNLKWGSSDIRSSSAKCPLKSDHSNRKATFQLPTNLTELPQHHL